MINYIWVKANKANKANKKNATEANKKKRKQRKRNRIKSKQRKRTPTVGVSLKDLSTIEKQKEIFVEKFDNNSKNRGQVGADKYIPIANQPEPSKVNYEIPSIQTNGDTNIKSLRDLVKNNENKTIAGYTIGEI